MIHGHLLWCLRKKTCRSKIIYISIYIYIYMHTWYDAISITFIRKSTKPTICRVLGWPQDPGCGAEKGSLHTCIYSGGQIEKHNAINVTQGTFLLHFYTFQPKNTICIFFTMSTPTPTPPPSSPPLQWHICAPKHHAVTYMGNIRL